MNPFDYIKAISETKKDLMTGSENDELAEKSYSAFVVNKGLSFYVDTVLFANEMNMHSHLDEKPQFSYLLNSIRPRKRYTKWLKNEKDEDLELVAVYFGYSREKAKQVIPLITSDQLSLIKEKLQMVKEKK